MASSIPRAANKKNGAKKASAALETEPSLKKFKSSDVSFSPQTIETPEGYKQGSASNGRNRDEDLLHQYFRRYQEMGGLEIELENRDDFLERDEPPLSPEFGTSLDRITEDFSMIKDLSFKAMACVSEIRRRALTHEDDFKKTITSLEDIISRQDKRISLLTSDMDLKSAKLAEAEAKLKESELSKEHLSSRVESLEAELNRKQAEIEVLKNKAVDSEKKASRVAENIFEILFLAKKKKIIEMQKYSKALSTAAAKAVEDLKSSEEKSRDSDANLLLYFASSNQA